MDCSLKAIVHEFWNQSTVIDVHVSQKECVEFRGWNRIDFPIASEKLALLEHAAIDKHFGVGRLKTIAGPGNLPVGSQEMQFHDASSCCSTFSSCHLSLWERSRCQPRERVLLGLIKGELVCTD